MFAGVEIGGTKQQLCVIDDKGTIVDRISERFPIPNGAPDILNWIQVHMSQLLSAYPGIQRIGVGFGGPLETSTGRILMSVQVKGWKDFQLKTWFEEKFRLPTVVVNDTVAGGYAELMCGSGRGFRNFFYTNIGTGIGGSMFIGGKNYDGLGFGTSYMGMVYTADPRGKAGDLCRMEDLCCGPGIEARLRAPGTVGKESLLWQLCDGHPETLNCRMLGKAAQAGDSTALRQIGIFAECYAPVLANFITLLAPQRVSVGGGVANMGDVLLDPVRRLVDRYVFDSARGQYDIVPCELMDDTVIVGAALYARDGFQTV